MKALFAHGPWNARTVGNLMSTKGLLWSKEIGPDTKGPKDDNARINCKVKALKFLVMNAARQCEWGSRSFTDPNLSPGFSNS
jgi:hypothetical protein